MKKTIKLLIACFVLIGINSSCTDESTFNNPSHFELERGAFVRFTATPPPATFDDAQNVNFTGEIFDANGNISDYTLDLKATIGGQTYIKEGFMSFTSFPSTMTITSQSMADAIGLDVSEFSFGDLFEFVGTATRNDGVVFVGADPTLDTDNLTVGPGNTEPNLNLPSYQSAMVFQTIIACASFEAALMPGSWSIKFDAWGDYAGTEEVTVEAGPDDNTFYILNTTNPSVSNGGTVFLIVTVDDAGNVTDLVSNELYDYGGQLIDPTDGGGGLIFSCVGVININVLWLTPDHTGTYGTFNFVLEKN